MVSEKLWHMPAKDLLYITLNGRHQAAFFSTDKLEEYEKALHSLFSSPKKLAWVSAKYSKYGNNLLKASQKLESDLTLNNFTNFLNHYAVLTNGLWLTAIAGRHFHKLLLENLKTHYPAYSSQELDALAGTLTYPTKHTPLMQSQLSLLKIGLAIQNQKSKTEVNKLMEQHMEKYRVIPVNYNEDPWTKQDILKQLKLILKGDCKAELAAYKTSHIKKVKAAQKALQHLPTNKTRHFARVLQNITLLNEYRKFIFCNASLSHQDIFRRIAKMYNLTNWRECLKLTPAEIIQLYFFRNPAPLKQLPRRTVAAVLFNHATQTFRFFPKNKVQAFINAMNPGILQKNFQAHSLSGTVANPGMAKGKVKIILGKQDFHKFKPGNILIAPMTSVDFVPLMKQAAAFVTNEGGITSHASIVSREMNKPCIIGTKIATKIFKDGDTVEVDANNGIVKLIK